MMFDESVIGLQQTECVFASPDATTERTDSDDYSISGGVVWR